jgi:hypothetical protein
VGTLCLISCVSRKMETPAPAKDLYVSAWFRLASEYARQFDSWAILSAKHFLVDPEDVIAPYNMFMNNQTRLYKIVWADAVARKIKKRNPSRVVILAGKHYREYLVPMLKGFDVSVPMRGMGIGQQLQWLKANKAREEA